MYVGGSRLFGTNTAHSDWDLLLIMREEGPIREVKTRDVDAMLMGRSTFAARLADHRFKELCALWSPPDCRLLEDPTFRPAEGFKPDPQILLACALEDSKSDWKRVEKYIRQHGDKDSLRRGKKTLCCLLRELALRLQVAEQGEITDYSAGNEAHEELRDMYHVEWASLEADFGARRSELHEALALACIGERLVEEP